VLTLRQLLKILDFRNDESIRKSAAHAQEIHEASNRESEAIRIIAERAQVDSRSMKIMTSVAIAYLPANLVAVSFLTTLDVSSMLTLFRESSALVLFKLAAAMVQGRQFILAITS
jgi:hypothetical protein